MHVEDGGATEYALVWVSDRQYCYDPDSDEDEVVRQILAYVEADVRAQMRGVRVLPTTGGRRLTE